MNAQLLTHALSQLRKTYIAQLHACTQLALYIIIRVVHSKQKTNKHNKSNDKATKILHSSSLQILITNKHFETIFFPILPKLYYGHHNYHETHVIPTNSTAKYTKVDSFFIFLFSFVFINS